MDIVASQDLRLKFKLIPEGETIVEVDNGQLKELYLKAKKLEYICGVHYDFSFVEYLDEEGDWCDVRINDKDLNGYTDLERFFGGDVL